MILTIMLFVLFSYFSIISIRDTAIYAKEIALSTNKDKLDVLFYDFQIILKKTILNESICTNNTAELHFDEFKIRAYIICQDENVLIDYYGSYKNTSSSHREIVSMLP